MGLQLGILLSACRSWQGCSAFELKRGCGLGNLQVGTKCVAGLMVHNLHQSSMVPA
jgi:hypothetical protein